MKYLTGVILAAAMAASAPIHAEVSPSPDKTQSADPAQAAKPQVKKSEKPRRPRVTSAEGAVTFDGSAPDGQPKPKKPAGAPIRHSGTVPVTREGGKTCSGQDEYRVCW